MRALNFVVGGRTVVISNRLARVKADLDPRGAHDVTSKVVRPTTRPTRVVMRPHPRTSQSSPLCRGLQPAKPSLWFSLWRQCRSVDPNRLSDIGGRAGR